MPKIGSDFSESSFAFGFTYVKARLEESFPSRWNFRQGPTESGWESVMEIRATA
jgi:hypothetical protein